MIDPFSRVMGRSTVAIYALRRRSVRLISITTCSRRTKISLIGSRAGARTDPRDVAGPSHQLATGRQSAIGRVEPGVHDLVRDRRQLEIVVTGVAAQCVESCVQA
jgi:hypothetical protein